jgi:DNA-binding transcriptional ArsR family regulator
MNSMDDVFDVVARYFALLSEPTRLRIMHSICQQEKSVNQIVEDIGATQTNVSRHLGLMHRAGVLGRRKDGNLVLYRVTDAAFTELCRTVCVRVASELYGDKSLKRKVKNLIEELG